MHNTYAIEGHPRWRIPRILVPFLPLPVAAMIVALAFAALANAIVLHSPHARAEAHAHWTAIATTSPTGEREPGTANPGSAKRSVRISADVQTRVHS